MSESIRFSENVTILRNNIGLEDVKRYRVVFTHVEGVEANITAGS